MKIQLCIVGSEYKRKTVISLMRLAEFCYLKGWLLGIHFCGSSDIFLGRDWCLDGTWTDPPDKKPFNGNDYDYILWCDTDQVFDPQMVEDLLLADKEVISAAIKDGGGIYCQGIWAKDKEARDRGDCLRITDETLRTHNEPIEVDFVGFGFVLVRKGVYEKLEYSWHKQIPYGLPGMGGMKSEDGSWCHRLKEKGVKIWVHPNVKVNHIKEIEL